MTARRIAVVVVVILALGGCDSTSPAVPDSGGVKDAARVEASTVDVAASGEPRATPDVARVPDGARPDAAKVPDGPRPDAAKVSDGPRPDAAKVPDLPRPDAAKPADGAKLPDGPRPADSGSPCSPNPCQHGGTCVPGSTGYVCNCAAGWKGPACQTASYCDVVYRITGTFHSTDVPLIGEFTQSVGKNASLPSFNPARTTPFTPAAFPSGFMRLRFPALAGAPAAGVVQIVELYLPNEVSVSAFGTVVNTDVDESAGMLALAGTPAEIGDPPVLNRACGAVATGTLASTKLTWGACSAVPDNTTTWTAAKAQSNDSGCVHRMSAWGNVNCTAGFCSLITGIGNQRQTWDQKLNDFTFSSTNYATATFTMPEIQAPNQTGVKAFVGFTATGVIKVECDAVAPLTCDEK